MRDQEVLPFSAQAAILKLEHPEVAGFLPELLGVHVRHTCNSNSNLEEIYTHVISCGWCSQEFASLQRFKESFQR